MILPFIIWGSILLGIFLFFWMLFRLLGFNNIGIILALSNMSIVLIIVILVFNNLKEAQIEFLWFILLVLDFPVSLLYGGFKSIFLNIFGASNINIAVMSPLIFFALFGSFQYYLIGKLLQYIFQQKNRNTLNPGLK